MNIWNISSCPVTEVNNEKWIHLFIFQFPFSLHKHRYLPKKCLNGLWIQLCLCDCLYSISKRFYHSPAPVWCLHQISFAMFDLHLLCWKFCNVDSFLVITNLKKGVRSDCIASLVHFSYYLEEILLRWWWKVAGSVAILSMQNLWYWPDWILTSWGESFFLVKWQKKAT